MSAESLFRAMQLLSPLILNRPESLATFPSPEAQSPDLSVALPGFLLIAPTLLSTMYDDQGLRESVIFKRWIEYISALKATSDLKFSNIPFETVGVWDIARFAIGSDFLEHLELDADDNTTYQDSLLLPGQYEELAEFCRELNLLIPDAEIDAAADTIDWTQTVPESVLVEAVGPLVTKQSQYFRENMLRQWAGGATVSEVTLLLVLEKVTERMMWERWAERITQRLLKKD